MDHPIFRPGAQRQLKKVGEADLVIGLPTYKNPYTAAHVARVALEGARTYYPQLRTVLINADAGLKATTRRAVMAQASANGRNSAVVSGRYDGLLGHGTATAVLVDAALALDAKAIIILDSHTQSIQPSWIAALAHLVLENKADLILPRYRHWYSSDGLLSDLIVYPLFRALWGQSVRRPAAPEFALSPRLATALLDEDVWGTAVATCGLPLWLATYGIVGPWRVAQSALGGKICSFIESETPAKRDLVRALQAAESQFDARFQDTLSVLFRSVYRHRAAWRDLSHIRSISTLTQYGTEVPPGVVPTEDVVRLLDDLALGWIEYRALWQHTLTPENLAQLEALAALPPDRFYFPPDLWSRIIFDFAVVFNKGDLDPAKIVKSLFPLFKGRVAAFWQEVAGLAAAGREGTVAAQAVEFEESRSYLKRRWREYHPWRQSLE